MEGPLQGSCAISTRGREEEGLGFLQVNLMNPLQINMPESVFTCTAPPHHLGKEGELQGQPQKGELLDVLLLHKLGSAEVNGTAVQIGVRRER